MSMTMDEQIEAAERDVAKCERAEADAQDDLDDAKKDLRAAGARLAALEEQRDAPAREAEAARQLALAAERTGPMRPVGDRVVRTLCGLGEIPAHYAAKRQGGRLGGLMGADGSKWASDGCWVIHVDSIDGLDLSKSSADDVIGRLAPPIVRDDVLMICDTVHVRTFGEHLVNLDYATLIEDLFPGLTWHALPGELDIVQAAVNGEIVAAVMPMRAPS